MSIDTSAATQGMGALTSPSLRKQAEKRRLSRTALVPGELLADSYGTTFCPN